MTATLEVPRPLRKTVVVLPWQTHQDIMTHVTLQQVVTNKESTSCFCPTQPASYLQKREAALRCETNPVSLRQLVREYNNTLQQPELSECATDVGLNG